jgi:hypothetical protein
MSRQWRPRRSGCEGCRTCLASCWWRRPGCTTSGTRRVWCLPASPLDGARFLRDEGAGGRLASLVAHHSCAVHEARVRGLDEVLLAEFEAEDSPTYDALVFCDLTVGPDGEPLTYQARIDEIKKRYGPGHEVTRALELSQADLADCCERTLSLIAAAQVS